MAIDPKKFEMHFIKNSDYKTVFATGFIGGPTPNGLINIHVLVDRNPIPQTVEVDVTQDPPLEGKKETKSGIIREVPIGLLMDKNTAVSLKEWLEVQINQLEKAIASPK